MPEEYTNRELGIKLTNLEKNASENFNNIRDILNLGFKGVHERQDIANHGIKKNKEWIDQNRDLLTDLKADRENKFRRYSDFFWKVGVLALAIVFGLENFL